MGVFGFGMVLFCFVVSASVMVLFAGLSWVGLMYFVVGLVGVCVLCLSLVWVCVGLLVLIC